MGHIDTILFPRHSARANRRPRPQSAPSEASRQILHAPAASAVPVPQEAGGIPPQPWLAEASPHATQPLESPDSLDGRFVTYTIGQGDTLESISRKLYGTTRMVVPLIRINRIRDDRSLQQGARLLVPRAGLLQPVSTN